ncbi:hypothetical protein BMG_6262 (plasmid) [Priestia megaterium]|nr:hypothetical protein BMG_6262 [Priestia megaterium]
MPVAFMIPLYAVIIPRFAAGANSAKYIGTNPDAPPTATPSKTLKTIIT